jgi:hypothetical protein
MTHNNKINTIYKQTLLLAFISQQQQQKNRHFIHDVSMVWALAFSIPTFFDLFKNWHNDSF